MFGLEIWLRIEIKTLYEQVDSLNRASVKNIRTETNYQDGCRNTFCTSSFNPNRKYYLDHAHITIYFSPMIRILLPFYEDQKGPRVLKGKVSNAYHANTSSASSPLVSKCGDTDPWNS